jgi:hypothetical protein
MDMNQLVSFDENPASLSPENSSQWIVIESQLLIPKNRLSVLDPALYLAAETTACVWFKKAIWEAFVWCCVLDEWYIQMTACLDFYSSCWFSKIALNYSCVNIRHHVLLNISLCVICLTPTNLHDDLYPRSCLSGTAIVSHRLLRACYFDATHHIFIVSWGAVEGINGLSRKKVLLVGNTCRSGWRCNFDGIYWPGLCMRKQRDRGWGT